MAYLTVSDVKEYNDISEGADDNLISDLIDAAQKIIDQETGYTWEASADSDRTFDAVKDVKGRYLYLDKPLASITTVTNGDGTEITSTHYVTEPRNDPPYYAIKLKDLSVKYWQRSSDGSPEDAITVTGRWAKSTTAPENIKQACRRLVAYLYALRDSQVFDVTAIPEAGVIQLPKGIPQDVKMLLRVERNYM